MRAQELEAAILDRTREELISSGYEVILQPNKISVPTFLGEFRPDALAFKSDGNLVIEVATQSPQAEKRLFRLRDLVESQPGWSLRLIWTSSDSNFMALPQIDFKTIGRYLSEGENLLLSRHQKPALLLVWSCLEALARTLNPESTAKPQTPLRVVEQLALLGQITPEQANTLRDMARLRNRVIHGDLKADVKISSVREAAKIARSVLGNNDHAFA